MKLFITLELEGGEALPDVLSKESYQKLMDTIDMLRKEGIHIQYKETNLPRMPFFRKAIELTGGLQDIERQ